MRAGILSAGWWTLGSVREKPRAKEASIPDRERSRACGWDLKQFEQEQIRGLAQRLFFPGIDPPARQVIFSAIEAETDVFPLCRQVGEILADGTGKDVAFVDEREVPGPMLLVRPESAEEDENKRNEDPRATQLARNLFWLRSRAQNVDSHCGRPLQAYLAELRREFEYSIVAAPPAATSTELFAMAPFADGVVLVLSAQHTRRAAALKVRNALAGIRLLGIVLCEREFPIPREIYRRL